MVREHDHGEWPGWMATTDGHCSFDIMQRAQISKLMLWHWQQPYLSEGVAGLKRD